MMRAMIRRTAVVLGVLLAASGSARAGVVYDFNYHGTGTDGFGATATDQGYGYFTLNGNPSSAGLADVASFAAAFERTDTSNNSAYYVFSQPNLSAFSATVGAGGALTGLTLATNPVAPQTSTGSFINNSLEVTSLTTADVQNILGSVITSGAFSVAANPLVYHFTYTGTGTDGYGLTATDHGYGYFAFNGSSGTAGLGDLYTFYFADQRTDTGGHDGSYIFDNPFDLSAFSATIGAGGALTSLSLATNSLAPFDNPGGYGPNFFQITSLTTGDMHNGNTGALVTSGGVNPTPAVPEPATLLSACTATLFAACYWGRSRRRPTIA